MSAATLPAGWSVELQGLSASVVFTNGHRQIIWCDGRWQMVLRSERGEVVTSARGIPQALTMKEARKVGTAWLAEVEAS